MPKQRKRIVTFFSVSRLGIKGAQMFATIIGLAGACKGFARKMRMVPGRLKKFSEKEEK